LVYFLADRPYPAAALTNGNGAAASASSSSGSGKKDQPHDMAGNKNVRLPRAVLPIRYDVRLFPVLEKGNFSILGHVSIDIQCKMETDRIVLHSADIVVDPKSVKVFRRPSISSSI
jgi:aminopeptidase N